MTTICTEAKAFPINKIKNRTFCLEHNKTTVYKEVLFLNDNLSVKVRVSLLLLIGIVLCF